MIKKAGILLVLIFTLGVTVKAVPSRPVPPRLVNDFTNTLSKDQVVTLEQNLVNFYNSTTTQIAVVLVPDLDGDTPAMYAYQIGEEWGVGDAKFDNGVVILVKPKTTSEKGEVFIATGYGLEAVIPDAIAKRIVENEMIPEFKRNNYYGAIAKAVSVVEELSLGEYSAQDYKKKTRSEESIGGGIVALLFFLFIFLNVFSGMGRARRSSIGRSGLPTWILLSMLGSGGRSHGGSYGDFSRGGGSFGGFGGGSFGGGGAGGSW